MAEAGLERLHIARRALAEATTLPEIASLIDQAEVIRVAAKAAGLSTEARNDWTHYKVDCERAAAAAILRLRASGELAALGQTARKTRRPTLGQLGIAHQRAAEWSAIAAIPSEQLAQEFKRADQKGVAVTESSLIRIARQIKNAVKETPPLPNGVFDVILADPPWQYDNAGSPLTGLAESHYATMPFSELGQLSLPAASNAVLFLWVTNPFLQEGLSLATAWGFKYKTNIVWVKANLTRPGVGFYVRGQHELLFICTRGHMVPDQTGKAPVSSVLTASIREHSRKPDEAYELIERLYPKGKYLELFARSQRPSWTAWGIGVQEALAGA